LQSQQGQYRGLFDCLAKTSRNEGFLALYKGSAPSLSSALVENSVGMTIQRGLRRIYSGVLNGGYGHANGSDRFTLPEEMALGGCTGVFTSIAICPVEVLKVRQQVDTKALTGIVRGQWEAARMVWHCEGFKGFYRGLFSLTLRDVPFNAIFYGSYESMCTLYMKLNRIDRKAELGPLPIILAGGMAGTLGWSAILPFDVVKTRLQTGQATGSVLSLMRSIVLHEGSSFFFALCWLCFSQVFRLLNRVRFAGFCSFAECLRSFLGGRQPW